MPNAKSRTRPKSISTPSDRVSEYSEDVVAKKIIAGPWVRLACERHLRDLRTGADRGLRWDSAAAERTLSFFPDVLRLAEGEFDGQPFALQPWQQFIVGSLFGWKGTDGFRRFRNAYVEIGKGNGKSPMAAGIGLYMLCADGEASAECYSAATTKDQAGILFRDAVRMVEASPALRSRIVSSGGLRVQNLAHPASGSFFRPVSSEHRGLDGKRVHYAAIDELHEHPSSIVVDKMRAGTKGRRQALVFRITNSGFDRATVCFHEHEYSRKIVEGQLEDDSWFAYVCALDEKDEWTEERCWPKANPNLEVSVPLKYLREQVREAQGMPSKQNIVKRLNFCVWTNQENAAIRMEEWNACCGIKADESPRAAVDRIAQELRSRPCFLATDLSSSRDLASSVKLFPPDSDIPEPYTGKYILLADFWLPEDNVAERMADARAPYDVWVRDGWIHTTPGDVIDYKSIGAKILADCELYDVLEIAFDPYLATSLANDLQAQGIDPDRLVKFPQRFEHFAAPTKELLDVLIPKRTIVHLANPVLNWNAGNLIVLENNNGDRRPIKKRDYGKIDGMVALIMGLGGGADSKIYDGPEEAFLV
jgi:phage terminase large subunit-like protein